MLFSALAKNHDKVIGMVAAYPTSGQKVAKKHQIFMGTMIIDLRYRLSYSVLLGLYDGILKEIVNNGFLEILAEVKPFNKQSLHLLLKYGFVLLDDTTNAYGYLTLNNYFPAILHFMGVDNIESCGKDLFSKLPVVSMKNSHEKKRIIADRFIECEYLQNKKKVVLLIDTVNLKVDGVDFIDILKIYPDYMNNTGYLIENKCKESIELNVEIITGLDSMENTQKETILVEPQTKHKQELPKNVAEYRVSFLNEACNFSPNKLSLKDTELYSTVTFNGFPLNIEHSSGFVSLLQSNNNILIRLMWPCMYPPYLEGALVPRKKDLVVDMKSDEFSIIEDCLDYKLSRSFRTEDGKLSVITILQCKNRQISIAPLSHIWVESRLESCILESHNDQFSIELALLNPEN